MRTTPDGVTGVRTRSLRRPSARFAQGPDGARDHRTFRRIRAARLEELISASRPAPAVEAGSDSGSGSSGESGTASPGQSEPPTGPEPGSSDRGSGMGGSPL